MKKEFCMMAIGLLLAGCSADEEIANVRTSESNVIGFNVVSNNPQTKATIINSQEEFQGLDLEVFALKDGVPFMGTLTESGETGVKLVHQDGAWDYDHSVNEYYWPHNEPLDFYAIAPFDFSLNSHSVLSNRQIYVYINDEVLYPGQGTNEDIMYAMALGQTKDTNQGKVRLEFKHLLSQVSFQAKTSGDNLHIAIASMELYNVCSAGTFTLPSNSVDEGIWSYNQILAHSKYGIAQESSDVVVGPNMITPISGSKTMLFIPQTLSPWEASMSNPITEDDPFLVNTRESYLKIKCKIWQNTSSGNHYLLGNESVYDYSYVPFPATWESGKHYKYTLIFGGGYHKNGSEIDINPISFDVSVSDWQTETPDMDIDNPLAGGE